jgi:hypothetical protein
MALLISFGAYILLGILAWASVLFHDSIALSLLLEIFIGGAAAIFLYLKIINLERT